MDIKPDQKKAREKKGPEKRKAPKKITANYLHNSGLYYLQRFSASKKQFRDVMIRKIRKSCMVHKDQDFEKCAAMVDETIKTFERAGLLNDELYAQGVVASLRRAGKSKNAILMKMKIRGLPNELTKQKLEAHDADHGENGDIRAAIKVLRKKRVGPFGEMKEGQKDKILAALARAGFSYDTAQHVLNLSREDAEEILNA